jgi:hypothetical protein
LLETLCHILFEKLMGIFEIGPGSFFAAKLIAKVR